MRCVVCGYETQDNSDKFCQNCGHKYNSNYCTNPHCYQRNNGEIVPCDETACYCPDCGSKTEYFEKSLIEPQDYL